MAHCARIGAKSPENKERERKELGGTGGPPVASGGSPQAFLSDGWPRIP